jgi:hypothetical protein
LPSLGGKMLSSSGGKLSIHKVDRFG